MQVLPVTGDPMTMRVRHVSSHFGLHEPSSEVATSPRAVAIMETQESQNMFAAFRDQK